MTSAQNGTISLWKDKTIIKSAKLFNDWALVLHKDGCIFAASTYSVVELNMNLDVVVKFDGRFRRPLRIDANESYLAVGNNAGLVDVYNRKLGKNGKHKKNRVRKFFQ